MSTSSPRGEALARKVRARDLKEARAREQRDREERERRIELQRQAARRQQKGRPRVVVREGEGERTLVFRGPHADGDLWLLTAMLGPFVVLPMWIGLAFVHWSLALSTVVLSVGAWLVYVYSPILITVTRNGYFEAKRPWLPSRDVGTWQELDVEVCQSGDFYRRCDIESKRWRLWKVHKLTPQDEATIVAFSSRPFAEAEDRPHDGGYRRAA